MKKQTIRDTRAQSTSTSIEPQTVTRHGLRKTRKKETIFRLQLRRLDIQTKTDTKDSISILLTTARPISSQAELHRQWKRTDSFAILLSKQQENS